MENLKTALTWFDIVTVKDDDSKYKVIEQFVQDVIDFSSQYGSDISVSYSALNLSGKPSNFPDYGDFPQACVTVPTTSNIYTNNYYQLALLLIMI